MKIAVIGAKGLPPKQGGIEHYCAEVYPRMVARGHEVDLFSRSSYTDYTWLTKYDFQGVRVISLPSWKLRGIDAFITSAQGALATNLKKYDVVHFHALGPSLFSFLPRIVNSTKVVVTCHGLDWQRAKWGNFSSQLLKMGEKTAVNFAHELTVVSDALKNYFLQTYNRDVVYIPNAPVTYGKSDSKFAYTNSLGLQQGRYMLFLGRLVPEKRPELLIEAFSALKPLGWKLVIAGGVSNTKSFTSELLERIANDRDIIFAGELRGSRLWEIVRGAGLFVLPSDIEGLPLAMLEAMQEGIPIIASDIPPHRQLIGDERGILFEAGNIDSFIASLERATNNSSEMNFLASKAQQYVKQNYSWDLITSQYLHLYSKTLNAPDSSAILQSSFEKLEQMYLKNR